MDAPTGKLYQVVDGKIKKTPAANNANGWAVTHPAPNAEALAEIIKNMSTNIHCALILGFISGTEDGKPYRLMSSRDFVAFAEAKGIKLDKFAAKPIMVDGVLHGTRTKRMCHASTWFGFDRDTVEGMPLELEPDATFDRWWEMMCGMLPEIADRDYVAVKSASNRVWYEGQALADTNSHVYMQAIEANDTERFGKAGMLHSFQRGFGFMRDVHCRTTGSVIGHRPWTLYDPTTFSRERLFFDGSPIVDPLDPLVISGQLEVHPSEPVIFTGEQARVNTRALLLPTKDEQRDLGLELSVDGKGRVTIVNPRDLKPDVEFEYKDEATGETGTMTMREFVAGDVDRLRCQAVFRPDSTSMAGYVSKEEGCHPFMYDIGTNINYKYSCARDEFAAVLGISIDGAQDGSQETFQEAKSIQEGAAHGGVEHIIGSTSGVQQQPNDNEQHQMATAAGDLSGNNLNSGDANALSVPLSSSQTGATANATLAPGQFPLPPAKSGVPTPFHVLNKAVAHVTVYGTLHDKGRDFVECDLANAQRFSFTYINDLRFVPAFKCWFRWTNSRWKKCEANEERAAAQALAIAMAEEGNAAQDDDTFRKWSKSSGSSNAIGSVLREAAALPELVISADAIDKNWYEFGVANGHIDLRKSEFWENGDGDDKSEKRATVECSETRLGSTAGSSGVLLAESNGDSRDSRASRASSDGRVLRGFSSPDRRLFLSKGSDVEFDATATCPEWELALQEIFSHDQELVDFFQIFAGYSMLGRPVHEVMAFFVGNGSNGKSTIIGVLEKLFGEYKVTVDKAVLMTKRDGDGQTATPALARLKGVRLAVITETKEGDRIDESAVKSLSGSDVITARHLRGDVFDFDATFVSWIATNHPPDIRSVDEGTWRRILHFQFNRNFLAEKGRGGVDTGLKQRILDNELSGVLNWALEGVRQYYIKGLNPPPSVVKSTAAYREDMDIISDWLESECELGEGYATTNADLWESYQRHSIRTGDQFIRSGQTLSKKLTSKGLERLRHIKGHNGARGFGGIRLRNSVEALAEKLAGVA